ncbi:MAG: FAD-dependent oxidoreductase [Deltaproteobacteria bacterium]|nr:FAD-dependent oxidoreductase [Deltaproteobacteria bacterium]
MLPDDHHNRAFVANARPPNWVNASAPGRYNLVVVGAGAAGLAAAAHAAALGAKVAIVERHFVGGDLLATGTVPSKSLTAAARRAQDVRRCPSVGLAAEVTNLTDFRGAMERMRRLRAGMSLRTSADHLTDQGVDLYFGDPRFVSRTAMQVGDVRLDFNYALIATGARPAPLEVPGHADVLLHTSDNIFTLTERPARLVVLGAGPVGCELAQAFARLGSEVSILSQEPRLLPQEDLESAAVLSAQFESDGIKMFLGAEIKRVEAQGGDKVVLFDFEGKGHEARGDVILVAVGRRPDLGSLNVEAAGVVRQGDGVQVDDLLRTSNRRIFAAGDVASPIRFVHAAEAQARLAVANALLFGRKRASKLIIPHAIYTDPEIAHVGLHEAEALQRGLAVETLRVPLGEIDRAVIDGHARGFAQVHYVPGWLGSIVGATVVGRHAGEIIGEIALAMTAGLGLRHLSRTVHPYPTESEILKRLGDAFARSRRHPKLKEYLSHWFWLERLLP